MRFVINNKSHGSPSYLQALFTRLMNNFFVQGV